MQGMACQVPRFVEVITKEPIPRLWHAEVYFKLTHMAAGINRVDGYDVANVERCIVSRRSRLSGCVSADGHCALDRQISREQTL